MVGDALLPRDFLAPSSAPHDAPSVELMFGSTLDDVTPFMYDKPVLRWLRPLPIAGAVVGAIATALTRRIFEAPALRMADAWSSAGARVYTYRFEWSAPSNVFGACHCVDLPFLLGDEASWRDAPMLARAAWPDIEALGRQLRATWASFAHHGAPKDGEHWPRHEPSKSHGRAWAPRIALHSS